MLPVFNFEFESFKGPAVRATRAQIDRNLYRVAMRSRIENQPNLFVFQMAADDLIVEIIECAA